jgi:hypothetical protein
MFVPMPTDPRRLTAARSGESGKGMPNRPFSASAGATALVTGLVVVSYILNTLRRLVPEAIATLDWRSPPAGPRQLLLFEAFVTNQRKTADTRHVEDAHLAIAAFQRGMREPMSFRSSVEEPVCLSLRGAIMLRTGWETNPAILSTPTLRCIRILPRTLRPAYTACTMRSEIKNRAWIGIGRLMQSNYAFSSMLM